MRRHGASRASDGLEARLGRRGRTGRVADCTVAPDLGQRFGCREAPGNRDEGQGGDPAGAAVPAGVTANGRCCRVPCRRGHGPAATNSSHRATADSCPVAGARRGSRGDREFACESAVDLVGGGVADQARLDALERRPGRWHSVGRRDLVGCGIAIDNGTDGGHKCAASRNRAGATADYGCTPRDRRSNSRAVRAGPNRSTNYSGSTADRIRAR